MKLFNSLNDFFFGLNIDNLPHESKASLAGFLMAAIVIITVIALIKSVFAVNHKVMFRFRGDDAPYKTGYSWNSHPIYIKLHQTPFKFYLINIVTLFIYNILPIVILLLLFKIGKNSTVSFLNWKITIFSVIYVVSNLLQLIVGVYSYSSDVSTLGIETFIFKKIIVPLTFWMPAPMGRWIFERQLVKTQNKYISCQEN